MNNRLKQSSFKQYSANALWLLGEKIIRLIAGLLVGIWVARYLGPGDFGIFSYVIALVGLLVPLSKLGLDGIISRDVALDESNISELICTSIFMKFIGGLSLLFIAIGYITISNNDIIYTQLTIILSLVYIVKPIEVYEFFFRAKIKSYFIAIANSTGLIITSGLKLIFIITGLPLLYFAIANLLDAIIAATVLVVFFRRETYQTSLSLVNYTKGCNLLKESWPLIFSDFFALIYLNIDQIMINEMLGNYAAGQYSAAVRISSAWYFIPLTIVWGVQAAIVKAKKDNEKVYYERLQQLFTLMAIGAYILIVPVTIFSSDIIVLLFGSEYLPAGSVLRLHMWASLFLFVGSPRGLWVINESFLKFVLFSNISAGIINIILNYLWLPKYGIQGAAWATIISYAITYILSGFFFRPAIKIAVMQMKSILLWDTIQQFKRILVKKHN